MSERHPYIPDDEMDDAVGWRNTEIARLRASLAEVTRERDEARQARDFTAQCLRTADAICEERAARLVELQSEHDRHAGAATALHGAGMELTNRLAAAESALSAANARLAKLERVAEKAGDLMEQDGHFLSVKPYTDALRAALAESK